MPHVNIKHFPKELSAEQRDRIAQEISEVIIRNFEVSDAAVSIALQPVERSAWTETVYDPEIASNPGGLIKNPGYERF